MSVFLHRVSQGPRSSSHVVPLLPKTLADSEERQTQMGITVTLLLARPGYGTHHFHFYSQSQTSVAEEEAGKLVQL